MKAISLMYHDVVSLSAHESSGFAGADAATYKIAVEPFRRHLRAIKTACSQPPVLVSKLHQTSVQAPLMLTFDDGGVSAANEIADCLEAMNWRGHFFITAGKIGKKSFLSNSHIRELHRRGHVIGTHSYTHPLRMASLPSHEIRYEWEASIEKISGIIGERVTIASIPGGQYSQKIAESASEAGITKLFTSEPIINCQFVNSCQLFGRFAIRSWTKPAQAAALAQGKTVPTCKELFTWNLRKAAKILGGESYLKMRDLLFRHTHVEDRT
jgi:peptidoglycan/xylan/chitin deacetylase (PgdA/CDA1 family)